MKYEESLKLLKCSKFIKDKESHYTLDNKQLRSNIELYSDEYPELVFKLDINNSSKVHLKLTLHLLENEEKVGITRIDYFGQHRNPVTINEDVPKFLHPYKGAWFDFDSHHIHFQVEGYNNLSWAIPLSDYPDNPFTSINDVRDVYSTVAEFFKFINVVNKIKLKNEVLL